MIATTQNQRRSEALKNEYFKFVANTFDIKTQHVYEVANSLYQQLVSFNSNTSIEQIQIFLEEYIGPLNRNLSSLRQILDSSAKGSHDCVVKIMSTPIVADRDESKEKEAVSKIRLVKLLVMDRGSFNPCQLVLFVKPNDLRLKEGNIIRLQGVYADHNETFGTSLRLQKRDGIFYPVPFDMTFVRKLSQHGKFKQFSPSDIAMRYYEKPEDWKAWTENVKFFDFRGIVVDTGEERVFGKMRYLTIIVSDEQFQIKIRSSNKNVIEAFKTLDDGDRIEIRSVSVGTIATEIVLNTTQFTSIILKAKNVTKPAAPPIDKLIYPGTLGGLIDVDGNYNILEVVVAIMGLKEFTNKKDNSKYWACFIYDSRDVRRLYIDDKEQLVVIRDLPNHQKVKLTGIYALRPDETKSFYHLTVKLKPGSESITSLDNATPVIPPLSDFTELDEIDVPPKIIEGSFQGIVRQNKFPKKGSDTPGEYASFRVIDSQGSQLYITTFEAQHISDLQSLVRNDWIRIYFVTSRHNDTYINHNLNDNSEIMLLDGE